MGFLDRLLGRKKEQPAEGMQTAPPPASMPADEPHEPHGEDEEEHPHDEAPGGPPA